MSKICKFCWEPIPDEADECKNCGRKVSEMLEQNRLTQRKLTREGQNLSASSQEALAGKQEISEAAKKAAEFKKLEYVGNIQEESEDGVKISGCVILAIIFILIAAFAFGAYYYYSRTNKDKSLKQVLGVLALQEREKEEDTKNFDPNVKFKYSENPYLKDLNNNEIIPQKKEEDLLNNSGNNYDFGGW
ncbi:MAG: hypothetical protein IJS60_06200 [Abditibacteriota bacterium]|nr:hypothetical protein [Abditibacteriota bacterium]